MTPLIAAWVQSLYKIVALGHRSVRALAKPLWERETTPTGVMAAARRPDSGPG
jgi:hypothetical protein